MSINDMVKKETSSHSLLMFPSKIHSKYSNDIPIIPVVKKKVFYKIHKVKDTLCKNAFFFFFKFTFIPGNGNTIFTRLKNYLECDNPTFTPIK